ncbi:phospholipase A2, membrane associated-like [Cricetulus griseus]|uniref:Phospholipase A2 n=1 Tax=Cricetulus griseus TaxID=10029 RepID=A0A061IFI5_CRIGR|nr:phospholipase A2, membrane associated-like [Cricetulus griseus]ERE82331.1 phospholipase A2, membrane associated-like protein [Cricetulus griseus]
MKVLLLLAALIMAFGSIQIQGSITQLKEMIQRKIGKVDVFKYMYYGCHCGLGGGGIPKDATDWCCFAHDCCYDRLEDLTCGTKSLDYRFDYLWGQIICSVNDDFCAQQLCKCDKILVECFARNKQTYNWLHLLYTSKSCKEKSPSCSENRSLVI